MAGRGHTATVVEKKLNIVYTGKDKNKDDFINKEGSEDEGED